MEYNQNNSKNKKITWTIFTSIIGIFGIVIGWIFMQMNGLNAKVENYSKETQETKVLLAEMKTDLTWIKQTLISLQLEINKQNKIK